MSIDLSYMIKELSLCSNQSDLDSELYKLFLAYMMHFNDYNIDRTSDNKKVYIYKEYIIPFVKPQYLASILSRNFILMLLFQFYIGVSLQDVKTVDTLPDGCFNNGLIYIHSQGSRHTVFYKTTPDMTAFKRALSEFKIRVINDKLIDDKIQPDISEG